MGIKFILLHFCELCNKSLWRKGSTFMRVIAGKARRIQLKTPEGMSTRPTTDRIKETLFNMLQYDLYDANFLDLFAGSGAIGIEALSRGCEYAAFVEKNADAVKVINENLKATNLSDQANVLSVDIIDAINRLERHDKVYQFVFMDPPYNNELEKDVLIKLADSRIINEDTLIIVEASLETETDYIEEIGYTIEKIKTYKTNKHLFVRRK
ncbi:MAG: 16S rRNA (guanine(966)-N(2))-methyltransferase RsmD [bacterium]|nr:16S rRNA (guanine(966)-N(2))-methyltransferase RsmD [bacterium]